MKAYSIISKKGTTNHGIAEAVANIVKAISQDKKYVVRSCLMDLLVGF
jgi:malate/lactate dehydrogenase